MLEQPEIVSRLFRHYRAYTDGFLPEQGAVTDQANNLVLAFDDISLAKGALDSEDMEAAKDDSGSSSERPGWVSVRKGK